MGTFSRKNQQFESFFPEEVGMRNSGMFYTETYHLLCEKPFKKTKKSPALSTEKYDNLCIKMYFSPLFLQFLHFLQDFKNFSPKMCFALCQNLVMHPFIILIISFSTTYTCQISDKLHQKIQSIQIHEYVSSQNIGKKYSI